jgi:hypothetical protein
MCVCHVQPTPKHEHLRRDPAPKPPPQNYKRRLAAPRPKKMKEWSVPAMSLALRYLKAEIKAQPLNSLPARHARACKGVRLLGQPLVKAQTLNLLHARASRWDLER